MHRQPMLYVVIIAGLILFPLVLGATSRKRTIQPRSMVADEQSSEEPTPNELALDDPLEALRRYGTADDAARLHGQGVDLGALGYRPPPD